MHAMWTPVIRSKSWWSTLRTIGLVAALVIPGPLIASAKDGSELVVFQVGDLPVVISAPHGGNLEIPGVPPRKGEGLEGGPAGFRVVRDGGTEELALEVARQMAERMKGRPSFVISRCFR